MAHYGSMLLENTITFDKYLALLKVFSNICWAIRKALRPEPETSETSIQKHQLPTNLLHKA